MACRDEGVGLAAPQVGVNVRLMVYNPEGEKGKGREWILVNPRVISSGKRTETMEEGCLSFQDASIDLYIRGDVSVSLYYAHSLSDITRWAHSTVQFSKSCCQLSVAVLLCDGPLSAMWFLCRDQTQSKSRHKMKPAPKCPFLSQIGKPGFSSMSMIIYRFVWLLAGCAGFLFCSDHDANMVSCVCM